VSEKTNALRDAGFVAVADALDVNAARTTDGKSFPFPARRNPQRVEHPTQGGLFERRRTALRVIGFCD